MDYTKALVVDNDLRQIAIPEPIKLLGVTNDNAVNELMFVIPKTYGDIDLSGYTVRVNWMNAGGEIGVADTTVVASDDETLIARKWTVGRDACKYSGNCQFVLCLKSGENEYNTQIASLPVYKGIESDDETVVKYSTALAELVERIQYLAGKNAWSGTTWDALVNYDTVSNMAKQAAADAKRYASQTQENESNVRSLYTQIEDKVESLEHEEEKINEIYGALDFTMSKNICPTDTIVTAASEPVTTSLMGHVDANTYYCFSVDVGTIPGDGWGLFLIPDDHSETINPVVGISSSQTGRAYNLFRPAKSGTLYCAQPVTGTEGDVVFANCQIEEGYRPSEYVPYGALNIMDQTARDGVAAADEEIDKLNWSSNILSVANKGYTYGSAAEPDTLQAFKLAKKRGFDGIRTSVQPTLDNVLIVTEDGVVNTETETGVNCVTVNYADIVPAPLTLDDVADVCSMYGLGITLNIYGEYFTANHADYMTKLLNAKRIPHSFMSNNLNNLKMCRQKDIECEIILYLNSKPTIEDLSTSSTYANLRLMVSNAPGVYLSFPMAEMVDGERVINVNREYIHNLHALGFGVVNTSSDGIIDSVLGFTDIWISGNIVAKEYIQDHYPIVI